MEKQTAETPVKVGDLLKLGIVRIGNNGDPILIHKKFIIFLKDMEKRAVQLNALIEIKITKVFPNYAFAERTDDN